MQQVNLNEGKFLSTAKFYRILSKLEKNQLVTFTSDETPLYYITPLGIQALESSKRVLGQVGMNVTTFFTNHIYEIVKFSRYKTGKILYVDFPEIYDIVLMDVVKHHCDELYVLCEDSTFTWLSNSLTGIKQTKYEKNIIKKADNYFDLIILFYPGIPNYNNIYSELCRSLKSNKNLLVLDSKNPIQESDHFVVEILVNQFWPFDYNKKKDLPTIENEIICVFKTKPIDSITINGLELRLFEKIYHH